MDPPSYEEARLQAPGSSQPAPPATPPPSYREAVHSRPDPFPVLTPPVVPAAVTPRPQNTRPTIRPATQTGAARPVNSRRTPAAAQVVGTQPQAQVVVTQPQPVPVQIQRLTNIPAVVRCPFCRQAVLTKVTCAPGPTAWILCILIAVTGLICGFCLIPLVVPSLQVMNHSCPQCKAHLFTYRR